MRRMIHVSAAWRHRLASDAGMQARICLLACCAGSQVLLCLMTSMQLLAERVVRPAEWLSARASPTGGYTLLCGARLSRAVAANDA